MCFVFIWEQTATCATYSINWLVFITEMKSIYSAVRTGYLNKAVCASSLLYLYVLYLSENKQRLKIQAIYTRCLAISFNCSFPSAIFPIFSTFPSNVLNYAAHKPILKAVGLFSPVNRSQNANHNYIFGQQIFKQTTVLCIMPAFIFSFSLLFFLSCKTNARVKPAKTGHGPHSS